MIQEEKKYVDARNDVLKAMKSVGDLTPQQKKNLVYELFGSEVAHTLYNIMQQRFRWGNLND